MFYVRRILLEKDRIWTKGFTTLTLSNAFNNVGIQMLVPTIPLYLVALGATESQVGLVATSFFVSSIITRLFINLLLTRIGKTQTLFAGVLLTAAVIALYGVTDSVGAAAAMRVAQGLGFGTTTTIFTTLAADFLPDSRRGEGIGYFSMGVVLGASIAPAISLSLMDAYGFQIMFFSAACFSLLASVGVWFSKGSLSAETHAAESVPESGVREVFWHNLFDSRLTLQALMLILLGLCRSADMNFIALFALERQLDHLALYFSLQTLVAFCIRFFMGYIMDRKGRNWILIPGGCAVLIAMLILSAARSGAVMLVAGFFHGMGVGMLVPGMQVWLFSRVGPEKRNIASATYFNFYDIGISVGAVILGLLAEKVGYTVMYLVSAGSAVLYLIGYICISVRERNSSCSCQS